MDMSMNRSMDELMDISMNRFKSIATSDSTHYSNTLKLYMLFFVQKFYFQTKSHIINRHDDMQSKEVKYFFCFNHNYLLVNVFY